MDIKEFLNELGADFYTGVPDSKLRALCDYLEADYNAGSRHIIAANEGNAVGLAAGYYLATGKVPVVYLQNSGIGNVMNPLCSLLNEKVYGIPCIFIVGWRGEPGIPDEPQHVFQGEISERILKDLGCHTIVLSKDDAKRQMREQKEKIDKVLARGGSVAFLIRKGALEYGGHHAYQNPYSMRRESALEKIAAAAERDVLISTTGKTSRELFEIRERNRQGHERDFLTVGSMGHTSSIALGLALHRPELRVWCIDGDGAALMHMGALAVIGSRGPANMVHVLLDNEAHESVGGMPTAAGTVDFCKIAEGCGYPLTLRAETPEELDNCLRTIRERKGLTFLEVKCAIGSREDLGRPTISPRENMGEFMR